PQLPGSPRLRLRHGGARDPGAQHERAQPRRAPRGDAADPGARQGRVREDARRRRPAGGGGRRGGGAGLLPARRRRRPGGRGGGVGGRDANHERGDLRAAARARRGVGARDARRAGGAARPRLTHFSFGESFGASAGESFGVSLGFAGASRSRASRSLSLGTSSSVTSVIDTPSQPHSTLPLATSWGTRSFTRFEGMAKPIEPLRAAMLLTPITCPAMFTSGPPELPGLMAASVW